MRFKGCGGGVSRRGACGVVAIVVEADEGSRAPAAVGSVDEEWSCVFEVLPSACCDDDACGCDSSWLISTGVELGSSSFCVWIGSWCIGLDGGVDGAVLFLSGEYARGSVEAIEPGWGDSKEWRVLNPGEQE